MRCRRPACRRRPARRSMRCARSRPTPLPGHGACDALGAQERPGQVDVEHPPPLRLRELEERAVVVDARVVDEHVDPPVPAFLGQRDDAVDVRGARDVADCVPGAPPVPRIDAATAATSASVREMTARRLPRPRTAGRRLADPAAAAGDDHVPLLASVGHSSAPSSRISAAQPAWRAAPPRRTPRARRDSARSRGPVSSGRRGCRRGRRARRATSSLRRRDSQSSAGRNSKNGMCGVTIARCAATATEMPVFHACGHDEQVVLCGHPHDAARLGESPHAPDVGLRDVHAAALDAAPRTRGASVSHSPWAIRPASAASARRSRRGRRPRAASRGRRRRSAAIASATRSARSTESKAYWTSTISVMSGPAASRTARDHLDDPLVGPVQALVRVRARRTSPRAWRP